MLERDEGLDILGQPTITLSDLDKRKTVYKVTKKSFDSALYRVETSSGPLPPELLGNFTGLSGAEAAVTRFLRNSKESTPVKQEKMIRKLKAIREESNAET